MSVFLASQAARSGHRSPSGDIEGTAAEPVSERPIDLVHLARQTFGDKRLETELLRMFARQARAIADDLETAADRGDEASVSMADVLHTLVGSGRAVGAFRVADVARRIETDVRRLPPSGKPSGADARDLIQAIDEACRFIAAVL